MLDAEVDYKGLETVWMRGTGQSGPSDIALVIDRKGWERPSGGAKVMKILNNQPRERGTMLDVIERVPSSSLVLIQLPPTACDVDDTICIEALKVFNLLNSPLKGLKGEIEVHM
jgi:hypothetical protein